MKKPIITIIIFTLFFVLTIQSQTKVEYSYDKSGNRESRTIVLSPSGSSAGRDSTGFKKGNNDQKFEEDIKDLKITIYPNPTKGHLKIDISGGDIEKGSMASVFDMKGKLLIKLSPLSSSNLVDLSGFAGGLYVLKIKVGEKTSQWKILKE